jgi:hypothetical protein
LVENLKGTNNSEDLDVDGKLILKWILRKRWEIVEWMHLAQDRDQWLALVNMTMNIRIP